MPNVDVTIATHNVGKNPRRDVLADLFDRGATIIGCQEMADQSPNDFDLPDWVGVWWPKGGRNINETPVLWDRRVWELRATGSYRLNTPAYVGVAGAGGDVAGTKWITWARLRHREVRRSVVVGSVHTVASIRRNAARSQLMRRQVRGMVRWARLRPWRTLILAGDLNADHRRHHENRYLEPLWRARFISCWAAAPVSGGSMHARGIDHILLRPRRRSGDRIVAMRVHRDLGYDHAPVTAVVRLTGKARA